FGWLGDRVGRVRAMTVSVMLYSLCSGLSAASGSPEQLAVLRFMGALGMGGEWALVVALVMEVWPNTSRAWLAGWIGAFGNLGYTYPARRYIARAKLPDPVRRETLIRMLLGAGLSGVPLLATWSGVMWMYQWVGKLPGGDVAEAKPLIQISSSLGAVVGCLVA